jgi:hypothetical protein
MRAIARAWHWLLLRWRIVVLIVAVLVVYLGWQRQDHQIDKANARSDRIEEVAKQVAANLVQAKIDTCNAQVLSRHDVADLLDDVIGDAIRNDPLRAQIRNRIESKLLPVPAECVKILAAAG